MTRLEKMIGFPVPQEHRKELNERLNTYENCDRTTLISLLLQYDWEILQTQHVVPPKNTKYTMTMVTLFPCFVNKTPRIGGQLTKIRVAFLNYTY